jgi:hypothetical protein
MSTTTNFKRIALVAVAALGMGVLSSAPSQAVVIPTTIEITSTDSTTTTLALADSSTAASLGIKFLGTVYNSQLTADSVTVAVTAKSWPGTVSSAPTAFLNVVDTTGSTANTRIVLTGGTPDNKTIVGAGDFMASTDSGTASRFSIGSANAYAAVNYRLFMSTVPSVAGTYTYTVTVTPFDSTTINTANIKTKDVSFVVAAPATAAAPGTSTAVLNSGSSFTSSATGDSTVAVSATASTTAKAVIRVTLKDVDAAQANIAESVVVTTNLGSLSSGTGGPVGKSLTLKYTASSSGYLDIGVYSDGTAGVGTINISTASVTFAAKSVTFYSTTAAKIAATQIAPTLSVGSNSNVVLGKATDANGAVVVANALAGAGVYAYSSNTAVVSDSGTACTYSAALGQHSCALTGVSAGTATITLRNSATAGAASTVSSTEVITVTVSTASPATLQMAFNKTSYVPGEKGYLTIWANDSTGKPVGPQTLSNLISSSGISRANSFSGTEPTWTAQSYTLASQSTLLANSITSAAPVAVLTVYMPTTGGTVSVSATGGSSLPAAGQVKVTASATVTDNGAAALAAVTALATTVASLKTLITTLTNLVLKIQKKVKA